MTQSYATFPPDWVGVLTDGSVVTVFTVAALVRWWPSVAVLRRGDLPTKADCPGEYPEVETITTLENGGLAMGLSYGNGTSGLSVWPDFSKAPHSPISIRLDFACLSLAPLPAGGVACSCADGNLHMWPSAAALRENWASSYQLPYECQIAAAAPGQPSLIMLPGGTLACAQDVDEVIIVPPQPTQTSTTSTSTTTVTVNAAEISYFPVAAVVLLAFAFCAGYWCHARRPLRAREVGTELQAYAPA